MSTGTDPEFFIGRNTRRPIPASEVFPKAASEHPASKESLTHDNAAAEIRPKQRGCLQGLNGNIRQLVESAHHEVIKKLGSKPRILLVPAARFSSKQIEKHESLRTFGCDPSYVVREDGTVEENAPNPDPDQPWRGAGYHIHQFVKGWGDGRQRHEAAEAAQVLDVMLGCLGVVLTNNANQNREAGKRRELGYGLPSEFRIPSHGFEYRTLDPWPLASPMLAWYVHSVVRQVASKWNRDARQNFLHEVPWKDAYFAIMEQDPQLAYRTWRRGVGFIRSNRHFIVKRNSWSDADLAGNSGNDGLHPTNLRRMDFFLHRGANPRFFARGRYVHETWTDPTRNAKGRKTERYYPSGTRYLVKDGFKSEFKRFKSSYPNELNNALKEVV